MENSKHGSRSLVNLKLIRIAFQIDSTSTCDTTPLEKRLLQKIQQTAKIYLI